MSTIMISGTTSKASEAHAHTMQSHAVFPHWSGERVGFRLVFNGDVPARGFRGGGCGVIPQRACVPGRGDEHPGVRFYNLGFRLCVDWREG